MSHFQAFLIIAFINLDIGNLYATHSSNGKCAEELTYDKYTSVWLNWPATIRDSVAIPTQLCITGDGKVVTRKCKQEKQILTKWGKTTSCEGIPEEITILLHRLSMIRVTRNNAEFMSLQLLELTRHCDQLQEAALEYATKTLEHISNDGKSNEKIIRNTFNILENIVNCLNESRIISSEMLLNTSTRMVKSLNEILQKSESDFDLATSLFAARKITTSTTDTATLKFALRKVSTLLNSSLISVVNANGPNTDHQASLVVSKDTLKSFILLVYKTNVLFLPKQLNTMDKLLPRSNNNITLSLLAPKDESPKSERTVTFSFDVANIAYPKLVQCINKDGNGPNWATDCRTTYATGKISCKCYNFQNILTVALTDDVEVSGSDFKTQHQFIWDCIAYIGFALSLVSLSIIMATHIIYRRWRQGTRHHVLFHFSTALFGDIVTLLLTHQLGHSKTGCIVVAALQHLFTLSVACWMLIGSLLQYLTVVQRMGSQIPGFLLKTIAFAWGVPILFVACAVSINSNFYYNFYAHNMCWLEQKFAIYAFAIPLTIIFALNVLVILLILNTLCCKPKAYMSTTHSEWSMTVRRCTAAIFTMAILGLKWAFYYLAMEGNYRMESRIGVIMLFYLHFIFFPAQGFFIFILQFLWDSAVKDIWGKAF